jgi:hypothetical protein
MYLTVILGNFALAFFVVFLHEIGYVELKPNYLAKREVEARQQEEEDKRNYDEAVRLAHLRSRDLEISRD